MYRYARKRIDSGSIREVEYYPVNRRGSILPRERKAKTKEAKRKHNLKNAQKKLIRLINCNFDKTSWIVDLTYRDGSLPGELGARRDMRNFVDRLRRRCKGILKYIYVIEWSDEETHRIRVHQHLIIGDVLGTRNIDEVRDMLNEVWGRGRVKVEPATPDEYGLTAWARYIAKDPKGGHRWSASKNLRRPKETTSVSEISPRRAEKLARDYELAKEYLEKKNPGYEILDIEWSTNEFIAGVYLRGIMRKREEKSNAKKSNRRGFATGEGKRRAGGTIRVGGDRGGGEKGA